jgi:Putative prokaryotic signal transducing protein
LKELLRTNDLTVIAYATALLGGAGIEWFEWDVNMSILDGSLGILPRRLMVRQADHWRAEAMMIDCGIDLGR